MCGVGAGPGRDMAPIHDAAKLNDLESLGQLLDATPDLLEAKDKGWEQRPLHAACLGGCVEAARFLLDRGAEIDSRDILGLTPIMRASYVGRLELVSMLIARGADPALDCIYLRTALMHASRGVERPNSDHVAVIRLLLQDGRVAVDARDKDGETALWTACRWGHAEWARVLLVEGRADHTIVNHLGKTPMAVARRRGHHDCVQLLQVRRRREGVLPV